MSLIKVLAALSLIGGGAAAVVMFPGFSPVVEARLTPEEQPAVKTDRLAAIPTAKPPALAPAPVDPPRGVTKACPQGSTWSQFDGKCLKTRTKVSGQVRTTRIISANRSATEVGPVAEAPSAPAAPHNGKKQKRSSNNN